MEKLKTKLSVLEERISVTKEFKKEEIFKPKYMEHMSSLKLSDIFKWYKDKEES
jgi:hypothetical protein